MIRMTGREPTAFNSLMLAAGALFLLAASPGAADTTNPCAAKKMNPCSMKGMNPCGAKHEPMNPCAMKKMNPCAAKKMNPCGAKHMNPCAMKKMNPCGAKMANPCGGGPAMDPARFKQPEGLKLANLDDPQLIAEGEKLWNDRELGTTHMACSSCHLKKYTLMNETFAKPYPHYVAMPHDQAGVSEVTAAEMVNFCMVTPMQAKPLAWGSRKLAALTAYVESIRPDYTPAPNAAGAANPCAMKHGKHGMKMNPCGAMANPCGGKSH